MGHGTAYRTPAPPPPSLTAPSSTRISAVPAVVDTMLDELRPIFTPSTGDSERECYEVSRDLRDKELVLRIGIEDLLPGSCIAPKHGLSLARKVSMVFVNYIDQHIVRPGPDPEDRHGADLVWEAAQHREQLIALVSLVVEVDDRSHGLVPPPIVGTPLSQQHKLAGVAEQLTRGSTTPARGG